MCPLCERDGVALTRHHVKLARRDQSSVMWVCRECQQTIHGLFPGTELARRPDLWTVEGLRQNADVQKALVFVRKLPPGATMRMRERR